MSDMLEFLANFPIDTCKRRLESRHQNFTLIAWRGQTRVAVKVTHVDDDTYKFAVRRVSKSSPFDWGSSGGFHGYLRRVTNNSTAVVGQKRINWFSIIFTQILMIIMSLLLPVAWLSDGTVNTSDLPLVGVGVLVFNIIIFAVMYFYGMSHASEMENTVTHLLGQSYEFGNFG